MFGVEPVETFEHHLDVCVSIDIGIGRPASGLCIRGLKDQTAVTEIDRCAENSLPLDGTKPIVGHMVAAVEDQKKGRGRLLARNSKGDLARVGICSSFRGQRLRLEEVEILVLEVRIEPQREVFARECPWLIELHQILRRCFRLSLVVSACEDVADNISNVIRIDIVSDQKGR